MMNNHFPYRSPVSGSAAIMATQAAAQAIARWNRVKWNMSHKKGEAAIVPASSRRAKRERA